MWHSRCFPLTPSGIFLCLLHLSQVFDVTNSEGTAVSNDMDRSVRKMPSNRFISMRAACTRNVIMVITTLRDPFHGLIYAKGYPTSCHIAGNDTTEVTLSINVSRCGVRIFEEEKEHLAYELSVYIQFDRTVQKASDEQILVSCKPIDFFHVSNQGHPDPLAKNLEDLAGTHHKPNGRKSPKALALGVAEPMGFDEVSAASPTVHTWMDIISGDPEHGKASKTSLRVGEEATMLVRVYQQPGLSTRVVNCLAHDGSGDIQQELIDSNGCAVEQSIMPHLREKVNSSAGLNVFYAPFSAFKFPDKDHLHLKCQVIVCIKVCPSVLPCTARNGRHYRTQHYMATTAANTPESEESYGTLNEGTVVDIIDIFNAFEVIAPQLELNTIDFDAQKLDVTKSSDVRGRNICLSTSSVILSFGTLSGVAVIATVLSISLFIWGRRRRQYSEKCIYLPYYRPYESYT